MEIRAQETDDDDKQNISLMGQKGMSEADKLNLDPKLQQNIAGNYDFPSPVGTEKKVFRQMMQTYKDDGVY